MKVLGHVDDEAKERVERASGDSDFSISETPINPTTSHQDPIPSDQDNDDSSTEISVFDPSMSKVHPNTTINDTKVHPDSSDRKSSENESDMGSGIEVDSEEKLDDEDSAESQSSSQSFIVEDDSDNKITLSSRSDTMEEGTRRIVIRTKFLTFSYKN